MATNKKTAAKATKNTKTSTKKPVAAKGAKKASAKPVKKAAPAKKAAVVKKSAPAKKAAPKKAVPAKKQAVVKKVATSKKATPVKKKVADKKNVQAKNQKPVNKKNSKTVSAKSAPVKKVVAKKAAPAKKVATKKVAVKTVETKKPVKTTPPAKAVVTKKKEEPIKKVNVEKEAALPKAPKDKKVKEVKKKAPVRSITTSRNAPPSPAARPAVTRTAAREEKKTNIIVAHRRVENKSKKDVAGKTMINYQPDYTRSILDTPVEQQGPVYRYSDEELNEFRELITGRLEAARKELAYLQGLITRKDEAGTEDTENRYMNMEDGSGAMEREQLAQLASRQIQFISHLEKAMMRIENKTYGICRVTGKLIDKARLRAVPHATLSIDAKNTMSKK